MGIRIHSSMGHRSSSPPRTEHRPGRFRAGLLLLTLALFLPAPEAQGASRAQSTARLLQALEALQPEETQVLWVYLTDKATGSLGKGTAPLALVSERSLRRRLKVRPPSAVVDACDLPLDEAAVALVAARATRLRHRSKWLNAVSVEATPAQGRALAGLPCVRRLDMVRRYARRSVSHLDAEARAGAGSSSSSRDLQARPLPGPHPVSLNYGGSQGQLAMLGVPTLHDLGITGQGVLIGHFDNGYRLLEHASLASLQVVAAHDFVDGDDDPAPPPGAPTSFGAHGIITLSVVGGYAPGDLIGAAFGASFVLARTEDDASETPVEEDHWVAAIEWADSLGIDVASTSLGYLDYDPPHPSWTWEDMDGNTTAITRAADLAVARGIVVVNSAGNEGVDVHNTLIAPADGDNVIAVGALDPNGARSGFSSIGPTTDLPPRFKPDVMAQGSQVRRASASDPASYSTASGTSLSCPLVAGVAALLLSARQAATPLQIRDALRLTASQAGTPDNFSGWGTVNAVAALHWLDTTDSRELPRLATWSLGPNVPNPFNPSTRIAYELPVASLVRLWIYDAAGRRVRTLLDAVQPPSAHDVTWNGTDDAGSFVAAGIYFCRFEARGLGTDAPAFTGVRKLVLLP